MRIDRDGTIIRDNGEESNGARSNRGSNLRSRIRFTDVGAVIFYIITIALSLVVVFLMAGFVAEHFCDDDDGWGIVVGIFMFLAGIAGCLCYNGCSKNYSFSGGILSVLSAAGAALLVGVVLLILAPLIKLALAIAGLGLVIWLLGASNS